MAELRLDRVQQMAKTLGCIVDDLDGLLYCPRRVLGHSCDACKECITQDLAFDDQGDAVGLAEPCWLAYAQGAPMPVTQINARVPDYLRPEPEEDL